MEKFRLEPIELTNPSSYDDYEKIAETYGISFNPPINDYVERIYAGLSLKPQTISYLGKKTRILPISQRDSLPSIIKNSKDKTLKLAGLYFLESIKPSLAFGKDSFKPDEDKILRFCEKLTQDRLTFVLYYAFSKTQSPIRTGSPDQIIDFAEIEMLKHWATIIGVGQKLGFSPSLVIVDETWELPEDEILGFRHNKQSENILIAEKYLEKYLPSNAIYFRSLSDSVRIPLGERFSHLYQKKIVSIRENLLSELTLADWTPKTKRLKIFLESMTPEAWELYNIPDLLSRINTPRDFNILNISYNFNLLEYLIQTVVHFEAIMSLREEARKSAEEQGILDYFPEYAQDRVYGGVTRSLNRWSFLTHPVKYKGQTRNPMHGLALYDEDNYMTFLGYISYYEALKNDFKIINNHKQKPLFVVK